VVALVFGAAPYMPRFVAVETQPGPMPQRLQTQIAPTTQQRETREPIVIPAVFNPRSISARRPLTASSSHKAGSGVGVTHAKAVQSDLPVHATFMILQTTQFDASGSRVWTLCVWRVRGGDKEAERQLESAIVLSLI